MMGIAQKVSRDFADGVRARGQSYFAKGKVAITSARPGEIVVAKVRGTEPYKVKLRMRNGRLHASCTCPFFGPQGEPCKHIWATILAADSEALLNAAPVRPLRLVPDVRYHTNGNAPPPPQQPPQAPPPVGETGWPSASGGFEGQGSGEYRQIYPADRTEGGYPPPRRPQPNPNQGPGPRPYYGPNQGPGPSGPRPNQGPGRPPQGPGSGPHSGSQRGPNNRRRDNQQRANRGHQQRPGGPNQGPNQGPRPVKPHRSNTGPGQTPNLNKIVGKGGRTLPPNSREAKKAARAAAAAEKANKPTLLYVLDAPATLAQNQVVITLARRMPKRTQADRAAQKKQRRKG
ncbi:MAG TPA: SWIM zinc finger family protein, partial [Isosphaeraceae bacterium]|nr:SWIM zinc finger family protein [Isosphaeraceae bacterium]